MDLGYFETALPVKDIMRSMAFYEALGFARVDYAEQAGNATLVRGDCRIGLYQGHLDPDRAQLIYWQGPVDANAQTAERRGLKFRVPLKTDAEGGGAFMLEDPDGQPLFCIRMKTFYPQYPAHTRAAPAERPGSLYIDPKLGWYEASLPVQDMDATVAFYRALGFRLADSMADNRRVTLQNADCRLGFFEGYLAPDRLQLIFWQGDIDALAEHVRSAGLAFKVGPNGSGDDATFMLEDPDGHPLFFISQPGVTRKVPADDRAAPQTSLGAAAPLCRFIDRYTIEYVRTYRHPIERVFKAVTDEAEVGAWFFPPAHIDARLGGAYALGGAPEVADFKGVITAYEPPRLVRYGGPHPGPDSYWQFALEPVAEGTRMVFVQRVTPGAYRNTHGWPADPPDHPAGELNPWRPGTLSGWHISFDHLGDQLDGAPHRKVDEPSLEARYRALMRETQP